MARQAPHSGRQDWETIYRLSLPRFSFMRQNGKKQIDVSHKLSN